MYDVNVVDRLIDIEKKMFKSFVKLFCYRDNSVLFNEEMFFLTEVLLKKEEILISKLPISDVCLNNMLDDIMDNKDNFFDNKYLCYFVVKRISSIISSLIIVLDDDIYCDDDYEILDSPMIRGQIADNLSIQLLNSISSIFHDNIDSKNILEIIKYYEIFTSKKVSDKLVFNEFEFDSVVFLSDSKLCSKLDMDINDYYSVKNDEIYNLLEDLTCDLLEVFSDGDESYVISYMLFKFKFLINSISNDGLTVFNNYFYNMVSSVINNQFIQSFVFALNFEVKRREIDVSNNYKVIINEPNISYIINLIKVEGRMYELYNLIDFDNIDDNILSCLRCFSSLESCLLSKIQIDEENESIIKSMFDGDLSFFLSFDKDELTLITKRLFNILPYFKKKRVSPTQSILSYEYIKRNHIIGSLKIFASVLDDSNSKYFKFFKDIIFVNDFLSFDFFTTGNYMMIEDISDSLVCDILNIKPIEYSFDKNEQLIARADEIISDISIYNGDDDAYVFFRLVELENIINNLSEDYLTELKENVVPNDFYDKKIIREVNKFLKR